MGLGWGGGSPSPGCHKRFDRGSVLSSSTTPRSSDEHGRARVEHVIPVAGGLGLGVCSALLAIMLASPWPVTTLR